MDSFTLSVKLEEVNRIPKILSTQLDMCRDSQFYIHKMLYNYIRTNNYRHDFWEYEGYEFYNNSMGISRIGFTTGFKGFVHLTQFESKDLIYTFDSVGMKQVIFILADDIDD